MIEIAGYQKAYRGVVAVNNLSFTVQPGEILGLVGPNGAGKTTTLRAIAGIIPPTAGTLRVAGHDVVSDGLNAKRRLAYVPDDPRLFDILTVWEHLLFAAKTYDVPEWQPRAERLLEEFELIDRRDTLAQELSRGMRQKVAICCAYLHEPTAILFDEPHVGLDPRAIRRMKDSVRQRAEQGAAIVLSSHLLALLEDCCSHLLILHHGDCVYHGPMRDARAAYDDLDTDATLEEVFFRATEGSTAPPRDAAAP